MGRTPYEKGRAFEYRARDKLRAAGFIVTRCYASKGSFDLHASRVAYNPYGATSETWLVQVKKDGRIDPAEREALIADANKAGATPVLAWGVRPMKFHVVTQTGKGDALEV